MDKKRRTACRGRYKILEKHKQAVLPWIIVSIRDAEEKQNCSSL